MFKLKHLVKLFDSTCMVNLVFRRHSTNDIFKGISCLIKIKVRLHFYHDKAKLGCFCYAAFPWGIMSDHSWQKLVQGKEKKTLKF